MYNHNTPFCFLFGFTKIIKPGAGAENFEGNFSFFQPKLYIHTARGGKRKKNKKQKNRMEENRRFSTLVQTSLCNI